MKNELKAWSPGWNPDFRRKVLAKKTVKPPLTPYAKRVVESVSRQMMISSDYVLIGQGKLGGFTPDQLKARTRFIMTLSAEGLSDRQIAHILGMAETTVAAKIKGNANAGLRPIPEFSFGKNGDDEAKRSSDQKPERY